MSTTQILNDALSLIEKGSSNMYTLTLHKIGGGYEDRNIIVGRVEDRTCKWKVEMFPKREKFQSEKKDQCWPAATPQEQIAQVISENDEKVPLEPELLSLNGVYDSYEDIRDAVTELRFKRALKSEKSFLKSYRKLGRKETERWNGNTEMKTVWETTCGKCGDVHSGPYTSHSCNKNFPPKKGDNPDHFWNRICGADLIPMTRLDGINVEDGSVYHSNGGSFSICTMLGRVVPVRDEKPVSPISNSSVEELKELTYSSC